MRYGPRYEKLKQQLIVHEGCKLTMYHDTEGIPTIGVGRNLQRRPAISYAEAHYMLENDIANVVEEYRRAFPHWVGFSDAREDALLNMIFNLGMHRFKGFQKMIAAINAGDWLQAAKEGHDSKWARQVGKRADELMHMLATGEYND